MSEKKIKLSVRGSNLKLSAALKLGVDLINSLGEYDALHLVDATDEAPKASIFRGGIGLNDFYDISWADYLTIRGLCDELYEALEKKGLVIGRLGGQHGCYKEFDVEEWKIVEPIGAEWQADFKAGKTDKYRYWNIVSDLVIASFKEGRKEWLALKWLVLKP
jgi:hypothetical protein